MTWASAAELIDILSDRFGIPAEQILNGRRTTYRTRVRHVAAALLHETRYFSHSDIARVLNYGDHTGAAAAVRRGRQLLAGDAELARLVSDLRTPGLPP